MSDIILELPFNQVKNDCYKVVQDIFNINLHDHDIIFRLNQDQSWFDLPNEINLRCGDYATNPDIILIWHELGHYVHSLVEDLEQVNPLYIEYLPTVFEELCISFYEMKCEEYREYELKRLIALSLVDLALVDMKEVRQEEFYSLIEDVQNTVGINLTVDMLEVLCNTRYSGSYMGYVLCRKIVVDLNI